MIFQFIATGILGCVVLYAYTQARMAPKVSAIAIVIALVGEYFVLFPDHAMWVANAVGIGRGADLIFYLWILFSLVALLYLHLKLRVANERFVSLIRELALQRADTAEASERG
jgi:small membrane protein